LTTSKTFDDLGMLEACEDHAISKLVTEGGAGAFDPVEK
jgi:hypothetical protein